MSLISSQSVDLFSSLKKHKTFSGELEVKEEHEKGTIQSFFDKDKLAELIKGTNFKVKWCEIHTIKDCNEKYAHSRYYIVLEK